MAVVAGVVALAVAGAVFVRSYLPRERGTPVVSRARMQVVLDALLEARASAGGWPHCGGKNFVLFSVAQGMISPEDPDRVRALFSPADPILKPSTVDMSRYGEVTLERLLRGDDFSELTSFAGRRSAAPGHALAKAHGEPEPLIADLHYRSFVLIGYSDGSVRRHTYEELGLPRQGMVFREIALGDEATSDVLRKLSRE